MGRKIVTRIEAKTDPTGKENLLRLVLDLAKHIWPEWDVEARSQEPRALGKFEDRLDAIVKAILERVAVEDEMRKDKDGNTILHHAAICEDHGIVAAFLGSPNKEDVISKLVNAPNKRGRTPLHLSARNGFLETVNALLKSGAKNDAVDDFGELPFHEAAKSGETEVLDAIWDATKIPDVNAKTKQGRTALHFAVIHGNKGAVGWLLKKGAKVGEEDGDGNTPLHYAVLIPSRTDNVKLLVESGAALCCTNKDGMMPVTYGRGQRMIGALLSPSVRKPTGMKIDALAKDGYGKTIVHYAAEGANSARMTWLLELAAQQAQEMHVEGDITLLQDTDGNTPLHHAAKEGNRLAAQALLQSKSGSAEALMKAKNDAQMTPILCALFGNQEEIFEYLCGLPGAFISFESIDAELQEEIKRQAQADAAKKKEEAAQTQVPRFRCVIDFLQKRYQTEPELPSSLPTYLALHARKNLVFNLLLERGNMHVNMVDKEHHRTCLHWAVLFGRRDVISRLIGTKADLQQDRDLQQNSDHEGGDAGASPGKGSPSKRRILRTGSDDAISGLPKMNAATTLAHPHLDLNAKDKQGQTALQYALECEETRIQRQLLQRAGVTAEDILYRDRQSYVDAANAILVGAALIASVTFAGWLQPPLNYTSYYDLPVGSFAPGTYESYAAVAQHKGVRVFWACNSLSFFFPMATVLVGTAAVLPMPRKSIADVVKRVRMALVWAASLVVMSVMFVLCAFVAAGFVVLPPVFKYQANMLGTTTVGGLLCLVVMLWFLLQLRHSLPPLIGRQKEVSYDTLPSDREGDNLALGPRGKGHDGPEDERHKTRKNFQTKFRLDDENEYIAKNGKRKQCQVAFP